MAGRWIVIVGGWVGDITDSSGGCSSLWEGPGCGCLAWKLRPQRLECSLSNIGSAHFRKDNFDPSNDDKVSLRITPQKVRFVRRMLLFTRHPNLASATPPPKVKRLIIQNTNAEGYVCSITQRTQGDWVMDAKWWFCLLVQVYRTNTLK